MYADGVLTAVRRGIMPTVTLDPVAAPTVRGFAPDHPMSRADVAAPLVRLWQVLDQECPDDDAAERFDDIDDLQVAADAVCLRGLGVTGGTGAASYSPQQPASRAQAASLLARVWRLLGHDCPADDAAPFDDDVADSVHLDDISCLRALGITGGTGASTFAPDRQVTRAEFATMVARLHHLADPPPAPRPPKKSQQTPPPKKRQPTPKPRQQQTPPTQAPTRPTRQTQAPTLAPIRPTRLTPAPTQAPTRLTRLTRPTQAPTLAPIRRTRPTQAPTLAPIRRTRPTQAPTQAATPPTQAPTRLTRRTPPTQAPTRPIRADSGTDPRRSG